VAEGRKGKGAFAGTKFVAPPLRGRLSRVSHSKGKEEEEGGKVDFDGQSNVDVPPFPRDRTRAPRTLSGDRRGKRGRQQLRPSGVAEATTTVTLMPLRKLDRNCGGSVSEMWKERKRRKWR